MSSHDWTVVILGCCQGKCLKTKGLGYGNHDHQVSVMVTGNQSSISLCKVLAARKDLVPVPGINNAQQPLPTRY